MVINMDQINFQLMLSLWFDVILWSFGSLGLKWALFLDLSLGVMVSHGVVVFC